MNKQYVMQEHHMKKSWSCLALVVAILLLPAAVRSQMGTATTTFAPFNFGVLAEGGLNMHRANFQHLPDVPNCCPQFQNGNGLGSAFGFFYEHNVGDVSKLGIRLLYASYGGKLVADEQLILSINAQPVPATIEHTINSHFAVAQIEPYYNLPVLGNLGLIAGANIGFLLSKNYEQVETLVQPSGTATFSPSGTRTRNAYSGAIPEASSVRAGLILGANYYLPLNASGSVHATTELLYDYGLTNMVRGLSWSVSALRGGVTIHYTPLHVEEPLIVEVPKPVEVIPAPAKPRVPLLTATMHPTGIEADGSETQNPSIRIEEFYSTQLFPLLPFILFDRAASVVPARYHSLATDETTQFRLLKTDTTSSLDVYHDVLNIVGQRLTNNPSARITITGCTSSEEEEQHDRKLARARAESVSAYLTNIWKIEPKRISIATRDLPENPSSLTSNEGKEENRRVQISSTDASILDPVLLSDTVRTATPVQLKFAPDLHAEAPISQWSLEVNQNSRKLYHSSGAGTPSNLTWDLARETDHLPRTDAALDYALTVQDSTGQRTTTSGSIPVHQTTLRQKRLEQRQDKTIEKFTLVLFNFESAELDAANRKRIHLIKDEITPGTNVIVTGHSDETGDDTLNLHLSEARAKATAESLGVKDAVVRGLGKSILLYDNALPEGRFYSRTVDIVLEKPITR